MQRLLGPWLAGLIADTARSAGVRFTVALDSVRLLGQPVAGVRYCDGRITADLTVSAVW